MQKKILINLITFDGGNLVPLLYKSAHWLSLGTHVHYYCTQEVAARIRELKLITDYSHVSFIEVEGARPIKGKFQLIFEGIRRNIREYPKFRKFAKEYDAVYSVSAVLDMILLPYMLKKMNKKIMWASVFDNTVPLFSGGRMISGNKTVRMLAWLFYRASLPLLKSADTLFVVKPELKAILIREHFSAEQLVITGNGVEVNYIKNAKVLPEYAFDALYVGRINEAKGIYDMLEVVKLLVQKQPDFTLGIMGSGDDKSVADYKAAINSAGLAKNMIMLGFVSGQKKYDIIKSSKCFLFLSLTESMPVVVMEAVSSGLKAFLSDLDCYSMYKNGEVTVFNQRDYALIAKKMLELFETKDFLNVQGIKLLESFSWERIAQLEAESIKLV